jgi:hypothetical protein
MVTNAPQSDGREEIHGKTWTDLLGPFNPDAEVLIACITLPCGPHRSKVLWTFRGREECLDAYNSWKEGN